MVDNYIPDKGDIIYVSFDPTKGHEQAGFRPAIVLSNILFNKFTGMAIVCPITNNTKEFPTHHTITKTKSIKGAALCEHIRSIDYRKRNIKYVERLSGEDLLTISMLIESFID